MQGGRIPPSAPLSSLSASTSSLASSSSAAHPSSTRPSLSGSRGALPSHLERDSHADHETHLLSDHIRPVRVAYSPRVSRVALFLSSSSVTCVLSLTCYSFSVSLFVSFRLVCSLLSDLLFLSDSLLITRMTVLWSSYQTLPSSANPTNTHSNTHTHTHNTLRPHTRKK